MAGTDRPDDDTDAEDGLPAADPGEAGAREFRGALRMAEALLFASAAPLGEAELAARLPQGVDVVAIVAALRADYRLRGVNLVRVAGKWLFRTAEDLAPLLARESHETRRLSRAALETLAIVAYHQPATRAEIEAIRGVSMSKGTLDVLLETGWVRMRGRRRTPGRPITYGTTDGFLAHFGLDSIQDLPGLEELKGAGLLEGHIPAGFRVPVPADPGILAADEDPLDEAERADLAATAGEAAAAAEDDDEGSEGSP